MKFLPAVFANLLLLTSAFGLGQILQPFFPNAISRIDGYAMKIVGGMGLLGTLLFLVGLVHFSRSSILAVLLPTTVLGVWWFLKDVRSVAGGSHSVDVPLIPAAVGAFVMAMTFLGGLAAPVGDIKLDAIAYHFLGPQIWLQDAFIHPIPDECLTSFPAVVETLFGALMSVGGLRAPGLFSLVALGSLLLVTFGLARRLELDTSQSWWAVTLVATMPVVYRGSYGGFNDAVYSAFVLIALRVTLDATKRREFILAGIFSGLAMGTKYTGIVALFLILICAFVALFLRHSAKFTSVVTRVSILCTSACVIGCPWYLRNWWAALYIRQLSECFDIFPSSICPPVRSTPLQRWSKKKDWAWVTIS